LAIEPIARGLNAEVKIHTDSQYLQLGMTAWLKKWKSRGWESNSGSPVVNQDLWLNLDEVSSGLNVEWLWVRGHVGQPENEVADQMAGAAARDQAGKTAHLTQEQASSGEFAATTATGRPRATVIEVDTQMSDSDIASLI